MPASPILKVGISASLSGQFRVQGRQALAGLQAWAVDVTQAGGIALGNHRPPQVPGVRYLTTTIPASRTAPS